MSPASADSQGRSGSGAGVWPVLAACVGLLAALRIVFVFRRFDLVREAGDTLLGVAVGALPELAIAGTIATITLLLLRFGLRRSAFVSLTLGLTTATALAAADTEYFAWSRNRVDGTFVAYAREWSVIGGSVGQELSPGFLGLHLALLLTALGLLARVWPRVPRPAALSFGLVALLAIGSGAATATVQRQATTWFGAVAAKSPALELLRALESTRSPTAELPAPAIDRLREFTNPLDSKRFRTGHAPLAHTGGRAPAGAFGPRPAKLNVLFVMVEGLEGGLLAASGGTEGLTPELDRLASEGLHFRRFFANGAHTPRALEASLCGLVPRPFGAPVSRAQPRMPLECLPSLLRREGFDTTFIHGGSEQFENRFEFLGAIGFRRTVFLEQFGAHLPRLNGGWGATDAQIYDRALAGLDARDRDRPFFLTVLSISNHHPFHVPDPALEAEHEPARLWRNTVRYGDRELGRFVEGLRTRGLLEDTLVFLFGDHGLTRDNVQAGRALELLMHRANVPLVVLGPKGFVPAGRVVDRLASQVDLLPTVLDALDLERPHHATGHSLGWTWAHDRELPTAVHDLYSGLLATLDGDGVTVVPVEAERTDVPPLAGRWSADPRVRPLVSEATPTPVEVTRAREVADAVQALYATERWWSPVDRAHADLR